MTSATTGTTRRGSGFARLRPSGESLARLAVLAFLVILFSAVTDRFVTGATFSSIAIQLPELGLLTLAMMIPLLSGELNLVVTYSANLSGLVLAWTLNWLGGAEGGLPGLAFGVMLAPASGAVIGWVLGMVVAYTGAHPILASLAMMIFLRGWGSS